MSQIFKSSPSSGVMTRSGGPPRKKATKRWDCYSPVGEYLVQALQSGEIDINQQPREIYRRNTKFHDFTLQQFRNALSSARKELGIFVRGEDDSNAPPPMLGERNAAFDNGK